jgi:hypothetical protein
MKYLSLLLVFVLVSCGKKSSSSTPSKPLFSKWNSTKSSLYIDLTGGEFDTDNTLFLYLPTTQNWIDTLNAANRDTTGLISGGYALCEMSIYFVGNEKSGNFATNHSDVDEPAHNACLEWDSNCSIGTCNYDADHTYTKVNNILKIDYFGSADNGDYGTGTFQ